MDDIQRLIVYLDDKYVIANKPGGMLSQKGKNSQQDDLLSLLTSHIQKPLHLLTRLDRPVSGLAICSIDKAFNQHFLQAQKNRKVSKYYLALVEGSLEIDRELKHFGLHDKRSSKSRVSDTAVEGAMLMTAHYKTVLKLDRYSLIQVKLHSGRFHQIRSQLSYLGHPIKGDLKYGAKRRSGEAYIFLHSLSIELPDMKGGILKYTAALPKNIHLWGLVAEMLKLPVHG